MSEGWISALRATWCAVARFALHHPPVLLVPLGLLVWLGYRVTHPSLIPGVSGTLTLLLPGWSQSHPRSATLSPLSYLRARWALHCHARSQGYSNSRTLAKELQEDEDFNWADGESPKKGALVRGWDRVMVWDRDCINLMVLESWRSLSDPLSDRALEAATQRDGSDVMLQVAQHSIDTDKGDSPTSQPELLDFWQAVDRRPPRGSGAVGLDWYVKKGMLALEEYKKRAECDIDEQFSDFASWKADAPSPLDQAPPTEEELVEEAEILQRGKDMFYRYGPPILVGLMHVGLSGGFASPRITDVLKATGYLMSAKRRKERAVDPSDRLRENVAIMKEAIEQHDKTGGEQTSTLPSQATSERTFRRLLETMSFVLDVMESKDSLTPPSRSSTSVAPAANATELLSRGGDGWLSSCRVRLIHTKVRQRLSPSGNLSKAYPTSSGIAINQEDLLATLTSFSIAPLYTLQRMGLSPNDQERKDYVALWRHVGFYMGIEPHLLERVFRDVASAERFFCCVASHHFLAVTHFKYSPSPPPISSRFGKDADEVRRFNFDQGPALPLLYSVARRPPGNMNFSTLCSLSRFLLGDALANAVSLPAMTTQQYLGVRLRLFVLAYPPLFARYYPRKQFEVRLRENCRGLLRRVIIWSLKGEQVSFESNREQKAPMKMELGIQEGNRLRQEYFVLMYEMLFVSVVVAAGVVLGVCYAYRFTLHILSSSLQCHVCL